MKPIVSRSNARFKLLRALTRSAHERHRQRLTVLDGPHLLRAYLDCVGQPRVVAVSERQRNKAEIIELVRHLTDTELLYLASELFAQIAPVEQPTGIMAVIDVPPPESSQVSGDLLVLLDRVQDPGNVGTIIRTAAGAGADAVLLCDRCADPWSPRALRAAMGATFAIDVRSSVNLAWALERFQGTAVATTVRDGCAPHAVDLTGPVALLLGSEGAGLSPELAAAASMRLTIPLARGVESLSVGAAAAIILFERARQIGTARS